MRALLDMRHSLLSSADRSVLFALRVRAGDKATCWPRQTKIAGDTSLSVRTVRQSIRNLERLGFIKVTKGDGNRRSREYELMPLASRGLPHREPTNTGKLSQNAGTARRQKAAASADRMNKKNEQEGAVAPEFPLDPRPDAGWNSQRACKPQQMRQLIDGLGNGWK